AAGGGADRQRQGAEQGAHVQGRAERRVVRRRPAEINVERDQVLGAEREHGDQRERDEEEGQRPYRRRNDQQVAEQATPSRYPTAVGPPAPERGRRLHYAALTSSQTCVHCAVADPS